LVSIIQGANAPLIEKTIKEQLDIEKQGGIHKAVLYADKVATPGEMVTLVDSTDGGSKADEVSRRFSVTERVSVRESTISRRQPSRSSNEELSPNATETFALIKPDAMSPTLLESLMDQIRLNRFSVVKKKKVWLTQALVREFYKEHLDRPFYQSLETYFTSGPCLALALSKEDAVNEWRKLIGPANSILAKETAPKTLRALFGTDNRINAVFGSDSQENAERELNMFFGEEANLIELSFNENELSIQNSPGSQKTLCLIKFDDSERREQIIERLVCRGISVLRREELSLTTNQVEELYPNLVGTEQWSDLLARLTKFPVLALVLKGENIVEIWKEMAGPSDPKIAKEQFPCCIRALFGIDEIQNAVHASIDADRALHEVNMFFPHVVEGRNSINVIADARIGTSSNPYPSSHHASKEEIHSMLERTLALIKPDVYSTGKKDSILEKIRDAGFAIVKEQEIHLTLPQAQDFYREHYSKPFFEELVNWMSGYCTIT
jgi:thioredoxin domain-containing protein 3